MNLHNFLNARCPELSNNIRGELYPPPEFNQLIAKLTGYIWVGGLVLLFGGDAIFSALGIPEPAIYQYAKTNKMTVGFGLFMLNNLGASMLSTGAFELYLNGDLIYSKLETGRMPVLMDVVEAFAKKGIQIMEP